MPIFFFFSKGISVEYMPLGCFTNASQTIPSLESDNATYLDGDFETRENVVKKCALETAKKGYKLFVMHNLKACHSGPDAHLIDFTDLEGCGPGNEDEVYLVGGEIIKTEFELFTLMTHLLYYMAPKGVHIFQRLFFN